jgi:thioredoxin 1
MLLHLEGNELDKIIKANEKVLVDFYADWCMPCKMLGGYIEELVLEHPEMMVAKVNVDNNQEAFEKYGEESIPLLLMFKNGRLIKKIVGFIPKANVWRLYNE